MKSIIFITSNPGKAKYLSDYFHLPVDYQKLNLPEIQSLDLREIAADKARRAYALVQRPVLVEDVSLTFLGLKKLPGPLIKWFFESLENKGLCSLVKSDRRAVAEVAFGYCDGKSVHVFTGERNGKIALRPRGNKNFGWDPIFIPSGYNKTWAEMTSDEKHKTSMRKLALEKLNLFLNLQ